MVSLCRRDSNSLIRTGYSKHEDNWGEDRGDSCEYHREDPIAWEGPGVALLAPIVESVPNPPGRVFLVQISREETLVPFAVVAVDLFLGRI